MMKTELKKEIDATLLFFIESDITIYGKIQQGTIDAFKVQGVEIPEKFKGFLK